MAPLLMQQIPLPLQLENAFVFDNFYEPNPCIIPALQSALSDGAMLKLIGHIGKTHLLQATCHLAKKQGKSIAYMPCKQFANLPVKALDLEEQFDVLCLDDIECIAGNLAFEKKLFALFNFSYDQHKTLILSGTKPQPDFALPDFQSRWDMLAMVKIQKLSEVEDRQALALQANYLGLDLDEKVLTFMFNHLPRSLADMVRILKNCAKSALIKKRKITVNFLREFLNECG